MRAKAASLRGFFGARLAASIVRHIKEDSRQASSCNWPAFVGAVTRKEMMSSRRAVPEAAYSTGRIIRKSWRAEFSQKASPTRPPPGMALRIISSTRIRYSTTALMPSAPWRVSSWAMKLKPWRSSKMMTECSRPQARASASQVSISSGFATRTMPPKPALSIACRIDLPIALDLPAPIPARTRMFSMMSRRRKGSSFDSQNIV